MSYFVERTIEVRGSNSVIGKIYIECLLSTVLKRCRESPIFKRSIVCSIGPHEHLQESRAGNRQYNLYGNGYALKIITRDDLRCGIVQNFFAKFLLKKTFARIKLISKILDLQVHEITVLYLVSFYCHSAYQRVHRYTFLDMSNILNLCVANLPNL